MTDIFFGFGIIGLGAGLAFGGTWRLIRDASRVRLLAIGSFICLSLGLYLALAWQAVWLADLLPFSNLIVIGNWIPIFAMALGAVAFEAARSRRRGIANVAALTTASLVALATPLFGSRPKCENHWSTEGDCVQSTRSTCTVACAATLLRRHGIEATEQELADLCFTSENGTNWQGLYRGLSLKTEGTPWRVEIMHGPLSKIRESLGNGVIVELGTDIRGEESEALRAEFGWIPGARHSVLLIQKQGDNDVILSDPTPNIGREKWDTALLEPLYHGVAIRLTPAPINTTAEDSHLIARRKLD